MRSAHFCLAFRSEEEWRQYSGINGHRSEEKRPEVQSTERSDVIHNPEPDDKMRRNPDEASEPAMEADMAPDAAQ